MSGIHYTEEERRSLIEATIEELEALAGYHCTLDRALCDALDRLGCSEIVVKYRELVEAMK